MKIISTYILYFVLFIFIYDNILLDNINDNISNNGYYFSLNIPKIDLNVKVYDYNDKNNDVNKGIFLVKQYNFDSMHGSIILASHSGTSSISYFKNLYLLNKNDVVVIIYNNHNYYYKINRIYKINKNGKFIYKNSDRGIYLITCDKKNKKKQIVYKGKLEKISKKSTF